MRGHFQPRCQDVSLTNFHAGPENLSALTAVVRLADEVSEAADGPAGGPLLYLHGGPGSGKSHLVAGLVGAVVSRRPDRVITVCSAGDFKTGRKTRPPGDTGPARPRHDADGPAAGDLEDDAGDETASADFGTCDLLVIEDAQRLPRTAAERVVRLTDQLLAEGGALVVTASVGPGRLSLPARLTTRWAAGLVVELFPLSPESRLALLRQRTTERALPVPAEVLAWLAANLPGSGRHVDGAVTALETLARTSGTAAALDLRTVVAHFSPADPPEPGRTTLPGKGTGLSPTVARIAERLGRHFDVEPAQLQSARRSPRVLLPRQLGMYLARQLTDLSLAQIGGYFGGRDHSTVLHACRKIEKAVQTDPELSGVVRRLTAELR